MIDYIDKSKCKYSITNNIVEKYIDNVTLNLKSKEQPICVINVGGPGSGKTTVSKEYIKKILKKNITEFVLLIQMMC